MSCDDEFWGSCDACGAMMSVHDVARSEIDPAYENAPDALVIWHGWCRACIEDYRPARFDGPGAGGSMES